VVDDVEEVLRAQVLVALLLVRVEAVGSMASATAGRPDTSRVPW
jgi:hypothetical protein